MRDNKYKTSDDDSLVDGELAPFVEEQGDSELDPRLIEVIRREASSVSYALIQSEHHSGPMPSPRQLAEYDKVIPGLVQKLGMSF